MQNIGVDIHKKQFTVCYRNSQGNEIFEVFENSPEGLNSFLETITCFDRIAVESLGLARSFFKRVRDKAREIVLVDTYNFLLIAKSFKKTDKHDAAKLAYGLDKGILPIARFRSEASQQLRSILTARESFVNHRVGLVVKLHSILGRYGINIGKTLLAFHSNRQKIDASVLEYGDRIVWALFDDEIVKTQANINELNKQIETMSAEFVGYEALKSIPGFGPITVATLLAYIDDVNDFKSSKELCSFFGIVPRTRLSDGKPTSSPHSRFKSGSITKHGCKRARQAITMSVNRVLQHNDSFREFYDRIKGRKGYRKARTAAARKLLTVIYFVLKRGEPISDFSMIDFTKPSELN
jgi:transposase